MHTCWLCQPMESNANCLIVDYNLQNHAGLTLTSTNNASPPFAKFKVIVQVTVCQNRTLAIWHAI